MKISIKKNNPIAAIKFLTLAVICSVGLCCNLYGKSPKVKISTVAVVVDTKTYNKATLAVDNYVESISGPQRKGLLLIDKWGSPDSIRFYLEKLFVEQNLEGAILIGDIPVPMIRDAHHLTTAFKMDQKRSWDESSVPSDRYYDDFDLQFKFLKQDANKKLLFYYSLTPESAQTINCDIYSSRIKAPEGADKYDLISAYLIKATNAHKESIRMQKILHFAGHGYNSESINARMDEAVALCEHFRFLNNETGHLDYIDFSFDKFVKERLLAALADKSTDLAILHHHGAEDTQYLNGSPFVSDPGSWIDLAKNYFRSKMRSAKDTLDTKKYFKEKFDVPDSWLSDAFSQKRIVEDSLYSAGMDIHIDDLKGYSSGAKIIIIDACYNGAFCCDDYIAAHYIFNPGSTLVVKANSVNTLQDTWTTELIGLLNMGASAGNWAKGQMTLESHLFGDATFAFTPQPLNKNYPDINNTIVNERHNVKLWKEILSLNANDRDLCDYKSLSIKMLKNNNAITSDELIEIQKNSPSRIVRLEAFNTNKQIADNNLYKAIILGMNDSYELTQRLSTLTAAKNYSPELLPYVAKLYVSPTTTSRVEFQLKSNLSGYQIEDLKNALVKENNEHPFWRGEKALYTAVTNLQNSAKADANELKELSDGKLKDKDIRFFISGQRNKCLPSAIEPLLNIISSSTNKTFKIQAAEALGWFRYSYQKNMIIEKCKELYGAEQDADLKGELLKTLNRLK